jgi:dihydroxyacid dehydratase/phosphogluconate dehydratase
MSRKLNRVSARITEEKAQGASQAMLHATGLTAEDLHKPQLGIAAMWYDGNPCNSPRRARRSVQPGAVGGGPVPSASSREASPTASRWAPRA